MPNSLLYIKTIGVHNGKKNIFSFIVEYVCMCQANFLAMTMMACLSRPSSVSMSTSMEITFDRSFCIRLLLLGSQGGASSFGGIPRFHGLLKPVHQTWTLFSASSFDHNFRPNYNQTFIVYVKSTLVL